MKKIKTWLAALRGSRWEYALLCVPFLIAMTGYILYYDGYLPSAFFSAIRVYVVAVDADIDALRQAAYAGGGVREWVMFITLGLSRWCGLAIAGTFGFQLFSRILRRSRVERELRGTWETIALHGSQHHTALLAQSLGRHVITGDAPERFRADRHILAFDTDEQMLAYLGENFHKFAQEKGPDGERRIRRGSVCLCVHSSAHTKYSTEGFVVNNMAEDCARLYWREHYVRRFTGAPERRVAIIGFGHYGQALLSHALLVNVFLAGGPGMEYHVFGDSRSYRSRHAGVKSIASLTPVSEESGRDAVIFHDEPWEECLDLLDDMDRIILCEDDDRRNIEALGRLSEQQTPAPVHVRFHDERMVRALYPRVTDPAKRRELDIAVFGTDEQLYTREIVLDEQLLSVAKGLHEAYMRRTGDERPLDAGWNELGTFLQRSNIMAADHMDVKLRQVLGRDCAMTKESLAAYKEALAARIAAGRIDDCLALEHERWMRYYLLAGWRYAEKRDNLRRLHPMLIPYDRLPEAEKGKDMDSYEQLLLMADRL